MGNALNYFKSYKIEPKKGDISAFIQYDGDFMMLSYSTTEKLVQILRHFGLVLPTYDSTEPPASPLLLQNPELVANIIKKSTCLGRRLNYNLLR